MTKPSPIHSAQFVSLFDITARAWLEWGIEIRCSIRLSYWRTVAPHSRHDSGLCQQIPLDPKGAERDENAERLSRQVSERIAVARYFEAEEKKRVRERREETLR